MRRARSLCFRFHKPPPPGIYHVRSKSKDCGRANPEESLERVLSEDGFVRRTNSSPRTKIPPHIRVTSSPWRGALSNYCASVKLGQVITRKLVTTATRRPPCRRACNRSENVSSWRRARPRMPHSTRRRDQPLRSATIAMAPYWPRRTETTRSR